MTRGVRLRLLDVVHADAPHNVLLAVIVKGRIAAGEVAGTASVGRVPTATVASAAVGASTAANGAEARGAAIVVLVAGRGHDTAKDGLEDLPHQMEDHGKVGDDDGRESLADTPGAGLLGAIDLIGHGEDSLQQGADKDENAGAENDAGGDFLDSGKAGAPEHGQGDHDKVNVHDDAGGKADPDDGESDGSLAGV